MANRTVEIQVAADGTVTVNPYHQYVDVGDTITWTCSYPFTIRFTHRWPVSGTSRGELRVPGSGQGDYNTQRTVPSAGLGSHPYWVLVNWPNPQNENKEEIRVANQPDIIVDG